jgi:hypothetical protein
MSAKGKVLSLLAFLLFTGCQTNLEIEEGIPRIRKPFSTDTKVFLIGPALEDSDAQFERSPAKVTKAFRMALTKFDINVVTAKERFETKEKAFEEAKKNKCDVVLYVTIDSWSYADAGFSGIGGRDEVTFNIMFVNPETEKVLERAFVTLANGVFKHRMVNINETSAANLLEGFTRKFFDVENKINDAD